MQSGRGAPTIPSGKQWFCWQCVSTIVLNTNYVSVDTTLAFICDRFPVFPLCFCPSSPVFLLCPDLLPCFGETDCRAAVPARRRQTRGGGGGLAFSQSRLSPQWPAVQLQLMCSTLQGFYWQHASHTIHGGDAHTHFHTLLWLCLARLSQSSQAPVPPCSSRLLYRKLRLEESESCRFQKKNFSVFKIRLEATPPCQEQTRLYARQAF